MVREDHLNNVKREGMYPYVRGSFPVCNFSKSYLNKCLTLEVSVSNKKGYVITLSSSPSQTSDEFQSFVSNLENLLINITNYNLHFVILLGKFNAKSKSWTVNNTATEEDTILENLSSFYGMKELVSAPTHILQHSTSCIDLILVNHAKRSY